MNKNLEKLYNAIEKWSNFLLFDIEANFQEVDNIKEYETIQIWFIKINSSFNILDKWSIYIKPTKHLVLSDFIKDLTWINQDEVNCWITFKEWLNELLKYFDKNKDYLMSYWNYDMKQIYHDCSINNIDYPFFEWDQCKYTKHINIKNALATKLKIKEKWMLWLLTKLWLNLEWKHHNWEDDCFNILKIIKNVFN